MTTPLTALDLALGAGALALAALTLIPRARTVQAMSFLGLGVLMSLIWLRLGSVDVALAEAALGSGLLSALLVWLAVRSTVVGTGDETTDGAVPRRVRARWSARWVRPAVGIVSGAVIATVSSAVVLRVEQRMPQWQSLLADSLPQTGVSHEITAVLLAFRAYDTLLETAVLMVAGIAVLALGREGRSAGPDGLAAALRPVPALPPPLRWLVRLTAPVLLVLALWLLFAGSTGPGGAFQSGALLAGLLILLHSAGVPIARATVRWMRPMLVVGVAVFILAGSLGPLLGDPWLGWAPGWSFAAILTVETALTAGITAGLYLLYLGLRTPEPLEPPEPVGNRAEVRRWT